MSSVQLIIIMHGLIKLTKTGGLYARAIERWNAKGIAERQSWINFKTHFISEYEKMLVAGGDISISNNGWGAVFNTVEDDVSSLAESIVQYVDRVTMSEGKASDREGCLSVLEVAASVMPASTQQYFAPEAVYNMQPITQMPPMKVSIPHLANPTGKRLEERQQGI